MDFHSIIQLFKRVLSKRNIQRGPGRERERETERERRGQPRDKNKEERVWAGEGDTATDRGRLKRAPFRHISYKQ